MYTPLVYDQPIHADPTMYSKGVDLSIFLYIFLFLSTGGVLSLFLMTQLISSRACSPSVEQVPLPPKKALPCTSTQRPPQ